MCARYSLTKRTGKSFLRERARKLLIPSTLGLFVLHWITGYLNIKMGGGLEYIPSFLVYPISVLSGIGALWFIQLLFLFSCVLLLLRRIDRRDWLWQRCQNASPAGVFALCLLIWGAAQLLNAPLITVYRFGIYLTAFLVGYYVLSHEEVQRGLAGAHLPLLVVSILTGAAYLYVFYGSNYTDASCLQSALTNLYLWSVVLTVLGGAQRCGGNENAFTRYMNRASFGIYVLHYPVLLGVAYLLCTYCKLPTLGNYLLTLLLGGGGTIVLYELVIRIPVLRYLLLGQRGD
jgi:peptidoglycan/LPS O-acetylase OafA/YrhL